MKTKVTLDLLGVIIAIAAAFALCTRAIYRFDDSWDGTSYHLVFAAYRAGILTLEDFTPIPILQEFYKGFPPLLDIIRGYTWRITGSILLLQIYDLLAIFTLSAFWNFNFKLPPQWTFIALLSVPIIQTGATTLYLDVFVNCFFAIPLSVVTAAFIERRAFHRNEAIISLVALGIAGNTKLQFVALSAILFVTMVGYQLVLLTCEHRPRELRLSLGIAFVASFAIFFTAWRNLIEFGNPLYPMTMSILGYRLPGIDGNRLRVEIGDPSEREYPRAGGGCVRP